MNTNHKSVALVALQKLVSAVQLADDGNGLMPDAANEAFRAGVRAINILQGKAKHKRITAGFCPVCQHYGSDCTGERVEHLLQHPDADRALAAKGYWRDSE